ncbi:MAG: DUF1364 domain-containing protein [Pseudomonadota bacterium]|nr:DUF1364 domain-containing protein [Pseudomonadota bacterium]
MSIIANHLRRSAGHPDAHCMVNVEGVCGDATDSKTAGCVLAHWRFSGNAGGGQKPDDLCAGLSCGPCHTAMDSNGTTHGIKRGSEEWLFYAFRSTVRTLAWWHSIGFISIKGVK